MRVWLYSVFYESDMLYTDTIPEQNFPKMN